MHSKELKVFSMKRLEHEKEIPQLISSWMAEFLMKVCKIFVSILLRVCEVVEEATRFLPCLLVLCWSARSHLGPPEFEIDDTSSEENPEIVERIKESLKDINFTRSSAIEGDDCTVCLSEFMETESVYMLPRCNHLFHKVCLTQWLLRNKTTCPLCRSNLEITEQFHLSEIPFQESSSLVSRYLINRAV